MKPFQKNWDISSLTVILTLVAALVCTQTLASEVYSWTDKNGVVHFTDMPPQGQQAQIIDVSEANRPAAGDAPSAPDAPVVEAADPVDGTEPGGEQTEVKTAAQARRDDISKARKERREAQAEIDNLCQKYSQLLAQVEPNRRVFYTDENGETVRMDDDQRLARVEESKAYLAENCE